jgi:hypothetical protein
MCFGNLWRNSKPFFPAEFFSSLTDASFEFQSEKLLRFDGVFHRQFAEIFLEKIII